MKRLMYLLLIWFEAVVSHVFDLQGSGVKNSVKNVIYLN